MGSNEEIITGLRQGAENIIKSQDFKEYTGQREFELAVTELSKSLGHTKELIDDTEKAIIEETNEEVAFVMFFALFTHIRRAKHESIPNFQMLWERFAQKFVDYPILEHIRLLDAAAPIYIHSLWKVLKKAQALVKKLPEHEGVINHFVELCAHYFEDNLDERFDDDKREVLLYANEKMKKVIDSHEKCADENVYPKFYLNYGRLLILLEHYNRGEDYIMKAIRAVPEDDKQKLNSYSEHDHTVREYEQYLTRAAVVRTYDAANEKYKELEKIKINNFKTIALMTTLIGFLLGVIEVFKSIRDRHTMALLMACYASLMLIILGAVLIGLGLVLKDRKKRYYIFDGIILAIGIAGFVLTLVNCW